ncbi:hypothetical protein [Leptolyngbya ohadii]|uniref:hypothetical protein n=1 Tax=Leptolyngbya ohadii TaxID=1962290 RepID=UPI000B59ED27|nr:hypothetical protein [Leptolyngbya ohadii]
MGRSPLQLAEDLVEILMTASSPTENSPNSEPLTSCFQIEVAPAGWIYFRLLPSGLSCWLQLLLDSVLPGFSGSSNLLRDAQPCNPMATFVRDSTNVFPILHAYARCHSFLRLGQQLGLLNGSLGGSTDRNTDLEPDLEPDCLWQIQQPHPCPWLLPHGSFRSSHPAEWQLVEQLCATLDGMVEVGIWDEEALPHRQAVLKQADRLSQTWQTFYAACRIADGTQHFDPAQAQVRLGLTCITQKLLHGLLRSIGLPTPLFL